MPSPLPLPSLATKKLTPLAKITSQPHLAIKPIENPPTAAYCISSPKPVDRTMPMESTPCSAGLERLQQPILPLVRLVFLLFLTGPFASLAELLAELPEEIEIGTTTYHQPATLLAPYLDLLCDLETLREPGPAGQIVLDEAGQQVEGLEAVEAWIGQQILTRELEDINSLLCRPCGCALCCVGPEAGMAQDFFEIPLQAAEIARFPLPRIDNDISRAATALDNPSPACAAPAAALYHWQTGWSLILPRHHACPQLDMATLACRIYPERPEVCRRPQIFAYILERDGQRNLAGLPVYVLRNKVLAVWDCPYVQRFQAEIAIFAELCGLEPVFKENKG